MEEYTPRQSDSPAESMPEEAGGFAETPTETDPTFVAESSQPNRNTMVALVGVVIVGAVVLTFMWMRSGPKPAAANAEVAAASATVNEFLTDGGKKFRMMEELLKNTEQFVQRFRAQPTVNQVKLEDLQTNPFQSLKKPPADDDEAKRLAAEKERKEKETQAVLRAAGQLQLQSIIHSGAVRTCMISGRAYAEQQEVNGFVIERINPKSVIVKKDGHRAELRMQK